MSIAEEALRFTGFFEAEVLTELMLRYWKHPHAENPRYREGLLETAAEILRVAISGRTVILGVKPERMNLVAAIWFAEVSSLEEPQEDAPELIVQRHRWVDDIRHALPSCFCDSDLLE